MERLTNKHPEGDYFVLCGACPRHNKEECGLDDCVYVLTKRLAAYENTGLTPEEINKLDAQRKAMAAELDETKALLAAAVEDLQKADMNCCYCAHGKPPAPCAEDDNHYECGQCPHDCYCKDCFDNSKWEWNGAVQKENDQ